MATAIPPLRESEKIEFGGTDLVSQVATEASSIVVASYNIRYAVGQYLISGGLLRKSGLVNSARRPAQVAANIQIAARAFSDRKLLPRPHVIALQEADKQTQRAGKHHVARELADQLQMSWVHAPAGIPRGVKPKNRQWWLDFEEPIDLHDPGDTGVALLSRLPLSDVTRIDLPWQECAWRPRLAVAATLSVGGNNLRIINAHVDPHAAVGGQLAQLEVLVSEADKFDGPKLILGDFNTLFGKKVEETRKFLEGRGYATPIPSGTPTWRGAGLRLHADWIFQRNVSITRWGVARPLSVSDHWPIWAQIDFSNADVSG
ncbi:MAG TPA: endonuclease/exonuclease/phosphatase family protein [Pyrinomonadaceae bacterium]|nr:endonuclease/exonuclease/phosphatase family protein [Pyrinomonadaceae bacterium]